MNLVTQTKTKLSTLTKDNVTNDDQYRPIFQGGGWLKMKPVNIIVHEKIDPCKAPHRNVPVAMKDTSEVKNT